MAGSSASSQTSVRRSFLVSKSKIPPQFRAAQTQVLQLVGDGVELFGFHDVVACRKGRDYSANKPAITPQAIAPKPMATCLARARPPMNTTMPNLNARLDRTASAIAGTVCCSLNWPRLNRRRLDRVMASTSVSPEANATAYKPWLPAISAIQAAPSNTAIYSKPKLIAVCSSARLEVSEIGRASCRERV